MDPKHFFQQVFLQTGADPQKIQAWINATISQQDFFNAEHLQECVFYLGPISSHQETPFSIPETASPSQEPVLNLLEEEETRMLSSSSNEENEQTRLSSSPVADFVQEKTQIALEGYSLFQEPTSPPTSEKNRYEVLKTLGEGGMGIVQLVHDKRLGREVALKKIKSTFAPQLSTAQKTMLWRLQREASITAVLEHPNIVPLYDMEYSPEGELRFTMRKIEGETLKSLLKKKKKNPSFLSEEKLLSIFFKICEAISYAHSKGVIHRDLKPENIMVGAFGEVYVMDWGIAKQWAVPEEKNPENLAPITEDDMASFGGQNPSEWKTIGGIGTPGYMPPEQKKNAAEVTFQSDIFALGKILKECITLYSPNEEFQELLAYYKKSKGVQKEVRIQDVLGLKLPPDLEAIIEKATHTEMTERYANISEMVQDIERYLKHQRVSVREYTLWETLEKWFKRNKKIIVVSVLILLTISVSVTAVIWQKRQMVWELFQESLAQAKEFREKAEKIHPQGKNFRNDKIKFFLDSLSCINMALTHLAQQPEAEQEKEKTCDALIQLACATKDYNLACYIAREIQTLTTLSTQKKDEYLNYVTQEQNKTLTQNLERLQYWLHKLKLPIATTDMHEKALLEISKMSEEEILQKLLEELTQATLYFTTSTERNTTLEQYYKTMITSIGHIGNIEAQEPLLQSLDKVHHRILPLPNRPYSEMEFMITLVKSLQQIQAYGIAKIIEKIRNELGEDSLFTQQTQEAYIDFTKIDGLQEAQNFQIQEKINRAFIKYQQGDIQGALDDYTEALRQEADTDLETYLEGCKQFANLKSEIGDFEGALEIYEVAFMYRKPFEIRSPILAIHFFSELYSNRSSAYSRLQKFQESLDDCNQALRLNPQNIYAHLNRANSYLNLKRFSEALQDFNLVLQIQPQFIDAYYGRAYARIKLNDLDGGLQDYQQVIRLNPKHDLAYIRLAELYADLGKPNSAFSTYQEALRVAPNNPEVYESRAEFKTTRHDFTGALADMNEAIRKLEQLPEVQRSQKTQQELSPPMKFKFSFYYVRRGDIYLQLQNLDLALRDYTEAIRYFPKNHNALTNRSLVYYFKKEYQKTVDDATEAIRLHPENFAAYTNRGFARYYLEDLLGSKSDLKKYLELTVLIKEQNPMVSNEWSEILKLFPGLDQEIK